MTTGPNISQQRALAYAPKPFAALSFLSSLFVMYYLLIRRPEKRKRMYHRLILATFLCVLPLSFVMFWGTWAMPADTPWAIGASGTSVTCSIQGFLYVTFYLAFPFYYASFSVFAYVALKNNFKEEKYVWMEKWIHIGAYLLPLTLSIVALAKDWINPGLAICKLAVHHDCEIFYDVTCSDKDASTSLYAPIVAIILAELLGGTIVITYLLCTFDSIQKEVDVAVGMKRVVEKARKHRLYEVAWQTGLYLVSFWFGYIPGIAESFVRLFQGRLNYNLLICARCVYAFQGFIILLVYFFLQQKSERDRASASILPVPEGDVNSTRHTTVSKIRANALLRGSSSWASKRSSLSRFSFNIFDGTPAEDSPWASFFNDDSDDSRLIATVVEEDESLFPDESTIASLIADPGPVSP